MFSLDADQKPKSEQVTPAEPSTSQPPKTEEKTEDKTEEKEEKEEEKEEETHEKTGGTPDESKVQSGRHFCQPL